MATLDAPVQFVSLGMVVLDELHFPDGRIRSDVLGGSGAFSTLGACMAAGESPEQVGCLVLAGDDFPIDAEEQMRSWNVSLVVEKSAKRASMRGKLQYSDDSFHLKTFGYTTPLLQPEPKNLPQDFLRSTAFHFLASPQCLKEQINELLDLRRSLGITDRPLLIWEPRPQYCKPNDFVAHCEASKLVQIFSPNHVELAALCGILPPKADEAIAKAGREHIQQCAATFMGRDSDSDTIERICVVRAGEYGALVATRTINPGGGCQIDMTWVDAFYSAADAKDGIVDPTGAGNAFLGALAIEVQQNGGDAVEAAVKASVASSFVLEQVGLPVRSEATGANTSLWNGVSMAARLEEYERKPRSRQ